MAVMTVAVCDEVRKDAQKLKKKLSEVIPEAEILVYRNRESLFNGMKDGGRKHSVLFMGLDGEKGESLETVRAIRMDGNYIPVILVTANDHFYKEAFEVFAFNYLTKPVEKGELEYMLKPIIRSCSQQGGKVLHFQNRTQIYTLQHSRLSYISSNLHNVRLHLTDGTVIQCRGRLAEFSDQLTDSSFLRCHQSFLINLDKITSLNKSSFTVGGTEIPISRTYLRDARQKYKDYLGQRRFSS